MMLTNPRVIAGLLALGAHIREDGVRCVALHKMLTEEPSEERWRTCPLPAPALDLPDGEDVRAMLGLAMPVLLDAAAEAELLAALADVAGSCAEFDRLIQRAYYARPS